MDTLTDIEISQRVTAVIGERLPDESMRRPEETFSRRTNQFAHLAASHDMFAGFEPIA